MADSPPITAADLVRELRRKGAIQGLVMVMLLAEDESRAQAEVKAQRIADAITNNGLSMALAGRHLGKPVTFEQAYAHVFGRDLTGKPIKAKGRRG